MKSTIVRGQILVNPPFFGEIPAFSWLKSHKITQVDHEGKAKAEKATKVVV